MIARKCPLDKISVYCRKTIPRSTGAIDPNYLLHKARELSKGTEFPSTLPFQLIHTFKPVAPDVEATVKKNWNADLMLKKS